MCWLGSKLVSESSKLLQLVIHNLALALHLVCEAALARFAKLLVLLGLSSQILG